MDAEERLATLAAREAKSELKIGEGGEGYIATELWCYNCGEEGHLGDVRILPFTTTADTF